MTAESTQTSPRSRRALLAGAIGGLGVWAASAIGRAAPAEAAAGDPIRMGRLNLASSTATTLQTKTSAAAYLVNQLGAGAAVKGVATSGRAIMGEAGSKGTGVWAYSPNHYAVSRTVPRGTRFTPSPKSVSPSRHRLRRRAGMAKSASGLVAAIRGRVRWKRSSLYDSGHGSSAWTAHIGSLFARIANGKTQLCVRFPTGAVQVIATEP